MTATLCIDAGAYRLDGSQPSPLNPAFCRRATQSIRRALPVEDIGRPRRRWRRPRRRRWRRWRPLHSSMSCNLQCHSMQGMQRIRNHLEIGGRGASAGCDGGSWCGEAPRQRRHRRCNRCKSCISSRLEARAVLVCCAGRDLQENHPHTQSHSHSSSSDFKDDAVQPGASNRVHAQAR